MNLSTTVTLYSGGPGSGCNPEKGKCGRHKQGGSEENSVTRALRPFVDLEGLTGMETIYGRFYRAGHAMSKSTLTPEEDAYVRKVLSRGCEPEIKQCYMNAQKMLLNDHGKKLQCHEGYIERHGVPLHHAWVSINGKVVDVTMEALKRDAPTLYKGGHKEYWGVDIDRNDVFQHMLVTRTHSPLTETRKYNLKYLGPLKQLDRPAKKA